MIYIVPGFRSMKFTLGTLDSAMFGINAYQVGPEHLSRFLS